MSESAYDAIVVGAGPNGLAAGILLASKGLSVMLCEAKETIGGGMRSAELTLPGYIHDVCSSIHPLGIASPFFSTLPLEDFGLEWIHPPASAAHPFDDGTAVLLEHSIEKTAEWLGEDAAAYQQLFGPLVNNWEKLKNPILGPFAIPKHPLAVLAFAAKGLQSASGLAVRTFKSEKAKGFFAGLAAHSIQPLDRPLTAAIGLILGMLAHGKGWPMPRGGSQNLADALGRYFSSLGGKISLDREIKSLDELPSARAYLLDVAPHQLLRLAGERFSSCYRRRLKKYRYGPGIFKMDWALAAPIPWKAEACSKAGTVHLGASLKEIAISERSAWKGEYTPKPYVLAVQNSLFDPSRAPKGKHTAWAYCHVPNGSVKDMSAEIENQIERFAPGFRDCILARSMKNTAQIEACNPNCIGGDITGGVQDIRQLYARPAWRRVPYSTPDPKVFICSSSTPPGGGVHGMCGYHAAKAALKSVFGSDN